MDSVVVSVLEPEECPEPEELLALYDSVGWATYTRDLALLVRGIEGSDRVAVARQDGALVGLARVLSDGATICYLQDVLVEPGHQRTGIGRRLVEAVFEPFEKVRQHVLLTDDDPAQSAFYEALGFQRWGSPELSGRAFVRLR